MKMTPLSWDVQGKSLVYLLTSLLDSTTVMSVFVRGRPKQTCQQSSTVLANVPFLGLIYCPFHANGQFLQALDLQSTDSIHPEKFLSEKALSIERCF